MAKKAKPETPVRSKELRNVDKGGKSTRKEEPVRLGETVHYLESRLGMDIKNDPWQLEYVSSLIAPTSKVQAVFCDASAGTGKTSIAISVAYHMMEKGRIDQIIYVRNAVSIRDQGFLPGDIREKELPYMQPGLDALSRLTGDKTSIDKMIESEQLVIASTSFLRGVDWDGRKLLIVDEAQNLNLQELQTVLTRPHDDTKVVVIGSSLQCDEGLRASHYGKDKLLAFMLFAKHFDEYTSVPVSIIKLKNNYRGKFSLFADMIQDTVNYVNKTPLVGEEPIEFRVEQAVSKEDKQAQWDRIPQIKKEIDK